MLDNVAAVEDTSATKAEAVVSMGVVVVVARGVWSVVGVVVDAVEVVVGGTEIVRALLVVFGTVNLE